jgi:hypothetical protein
MAPSSKRTTLLARALLLLAAGLVVGCAAELGDESLESEALGESADGIVGGALDSTNVAVVAVLGSETICSGTIIDRQGGNGYVLTSAHCSDPQYVLQTADYDLCFGGGGPCTVYPVTDTEVHPSWDGSNPDYDVRMVRFTGATGATPTATVVQNSDNLVVGQAIEISGFGMRNVRNILIENSQRRRAFNTLDTATSTTIWLDQTYASGNGGACSGDSGGPIFATVNGNKRIVGVVATGDVGCNEFTGAVRVSNVNAAFIQPYIQNN